MGRLARDRLAGQGDLAATSVFNSVDLPAPFRPSSATISRSRTSKETSLRMWLLP
jgi:hypothetical protein